MAKKYGPITVHAYVPTKDGGLLDVDEMTPEQKERLATEISLRVLNTYYAGVAKFYRKGDAPPE